MLNLGLSPRTTACPKRYTHFPSRCQSKLKFSSSLASLFVAALLITSSSTYAGVVINEIMYHPASGNLLESYVELRNIDNVATNISGWRLTKGIQFTFPTNTALAPNAYLVVAADRATFTNKYPGVLNFVAGFNSSIGHHLRLENANGDLINEVQYSDDGEWAV